MIVDDIRNSILQFATEGKIVKQNKSQQASEELIDILKDKKDNKKYSYTEVTDAPFEIPENWIWVKLEDICTKITDGTHKTPKYTSDGIPFISVKDISSGVMNFDNTKFVSKEEHEKLYERCNPEYGDILITKVGTTGIPVIVDTDKDFSLFVSVALLKINTNKIYNKFLIYFLNSPVVQKQVKENTRGVGNKNWVLDAIKSTILPLPPLEEQIRIVKKLEELDGKLEEVKPIENNLSVLKKEFGNKMIKAILRDAFVGKLVKQNTNETTQGLMEILEQDKKYKKIHNTEIPQNWMTVKLKDIVDIINGFTPLKSNDEFWNKDEINWFTVDDIWEQGRIIYNTKKYITKKALGNSTQRLLPINTVLLCCTASVGEYALTKIPLTTNQQFNGLVVKDELKEFIEPMYLYEYVRTLKNELINKAGKTTINFLSTKKLGEFLINIPPIEEQNRIVDKIEKILPLCDDIEKLVNN